MKQKLQVEFYCLETTLESGPTGICPAHTQFFLSAEHLVIPCGWRGTAASQNPLQHTQHRDIQHNCEFSPERHSCRHPRGTTLPNLASTSSPTSVQGLNQLRVAWVFLLFFLQPMEPYCPITALQKKRPRLPQAAHMQDKKGKGWERIIPTAAVLKGHGD